MRTPAERFWAKVDKSGACWLWMACRNPVSGYGHFNPYGPPTQAHRFSYTLAKGPIPEGLVIDHTCRVRACVNPAHLRAVTQKQNTEHTALNANNKSGVRGVSWVKSRRKWKACVRHNYRTIHVGYFHILEEAEAAVIAKRNELFSHNDLDRKTV